MSQAVRDASPASGEVLAPIRPANRSYFPALDGIRALAFLMVFAQHYLQTPWGWTGVDIFFVLSGFLITGILYDTCDQPHRVRNFYVRRTLRIFPLYYGAMLALLVSYPLLRWQWRWDWLLWPAYLGNFCRGIGSYAHGSALQRLADFQPMSRTHRGLQLFLGHFWSLCVEEQFYLVWPWIVFWIRDRRTLMQVCLAFVLICPVLRVAGNHVLPQFMLEQEVLYRWTPFRVDALLLGGLVALMQRGPSARALQAIARAAFCLMAGILVACIALHFAALRKFDGYVYPTWRFSGGLVFADLFAASVIVMALEKGSTAFRIFDVKPLRWLGRISYGAYVFHDIFHLEIQALVRHFSSHVKYGTAAVALVFTLLISWASFRWYESPFIRLKERWTA